MGSYRPEGSLADFDGENPNGVWTLPPSRNSSPGQGQPTPAGFDRAKYDAIGESDRMTLLFRKRP